MNCKNCVHYEPCKDPLKYSYAQDASCCNWYKDRSRYIEIPVKVGDRLYWNSVCGIDVQGEVTKIGCTVKSDSNIVYHIAFDEIGKEVFTSREQQLREKRAREENGK